MSAKSANNAANNGIKKFVDLQEFMNESVSFLENFDGIGEKKVEALKNQGLRNFWDLLMCLPKKFVEVQIHESIPKEMKSKHVFLKLEMRNIKRLAQKKIKQIVECVDSEGVKINMLFVTKHLPFKFNAGKSVVFYGDLDVSSKSIVQPKVFEDEKVIPQNLRHYFLKRPLSDNFIQSCVSNLIPLLPDFSLDLLCKSEIKSFSDVISFLHIKQIDSKEFMQAQNIMKKLESLSYVRSLMQIQEAKKVGKNVINAPLKEEFEEIYKYYAEILTPCQTRALAEILSDFRNGEVKNRMIFGDVGTGKTLLAVLSSLYVVSAKKQLVLLAPTSLLAKQHYENFLKIFEKIPSDRLKIGLVTSKLEADNISGQKKKSKGDVLLDQDIIIGTHSLFQDRVNFSDIGCVFIDEQHKFGVEQRIMMMNKGNSAFDENVFVCSLSATPIPRSLMMVMQNYFSLSVLKHKPKPVDIETLVMSVKKVEELVFRLKNIIDQGSLIYWVCPSIEEDEELEMISVQERYELLKMIYDDKVAFLHGKMKKEEQIEIQDKLINKEIQILVSTTIIEVGIDIKNADVIVIENSERFGLAQLHQLRGRVGRHGNKGYCFLLHKQYLSDASKARMLAMKKYSSGFDLSEQDLKIRGYGNLFGTQQSGFCEFRWLDPIYDTDLLNQSFDFMKKHQKELEANLNFKQFLDCFFDIGLKDG